MPAKARAKREQGSRAIAVKIGGGYPFHDYSGETKSNKVRANALDVCVHACVSELADANEERYKGQGERYKGQVERYKGQVERYRGQVGGYKGQVERYRGQVKRYRQTAVDCTCAVNCCMADSS